MLLDEVRLGTYICMGTRKFRVLPDIDDDENEESRGWNCVLPLGIGVSGWGFSVNWLWILEGGKWFGFLVSCHV